MQFSIYIFFSVNDISDKYLVECIKELTVHSDHCELSVVKFVLSFFFVLFSHIRDIVHVSVHILTDIS